MKQAIKKTLCIVLTALMLLTAAPLSGFVGLEWPELNLPEWNLPDFDFNFSADAAEIVKSGTCGENLTYTLDSEGLLTVTGTGEMRNYNYWDNYYSPWYSNQTPIKTVSIENGVTSIGNSAFWDCTSLTSVTIPDSVTSIGEYAFSWCASLTSVTIPDSVTSIGDWAFWECTSLTSVTIPDSVTSIGEYAFCNCTSLTDITVDADNTTYCSEDGVLFNKRKTELIQYPIGNARTSYTIPDSVTSIGDWAFWYCTSLTSVTIGNSVTSIGDYAFYNCTKLTSVTIPDSVTSIGNFAFSDCYSLTTVTIPDSVTSIGEYAFSWCASLTSVTIPDSVTSIGDNAFCYCTSLTEITVDAGNARYSSADGVLFNKEKTTLIQYPIGNKRTTYTIPDSVTSIGNFAFSDCYSLTTVTIPDSVTSIGDWAFWECTSLTSVTIPDSVTSIGDYAFYNCTSLTSVTIPDSVTSIGTSAFEDCTSLTSVTIGDSVTSIEYSAFDGCTSLTEITILNPDCEIYGSIYTIYSGATIHGYTGSTAQSYAEKYNRNFVIIADENIVNSGICGENVTWTLDKDGVFIVSGTGAMKNYDTDSSVPWYSDRTIIKKVIIENGVTSIGDFAFISCYSLNSVSIPDSVTSIGVSAFEECAALVSVTFGKNSQLTTISNLAFYRCTELTAIIIPKSVTDIKSYAYYACDNLTDVYYTGNEADWKKISIGSMNACLTDATIHYNSALIEHPGELRLNYESLTSSNKSCPYLVIESYPAGFSKNDIIWTSSNERVAYIDGDTVHPIQYGKALITVATKDGKYKDTCELTVQSSFIITSVSDSLSGIKKGDTADYIIMLLDEKGNKLPVKDVTLLNENPAVLEILKQEKTETEIRLKVKGIEAGTAFISFSNNNPSTYNSFALEVYLPSITYSADKMPVINKKLGTNFSRSDMYVENFAYSYSDLAGCYFASMTVYNKNSMGGIVASYTQDGQLYEIAEVDGHTALPTDYFNFLVILGKGAVDLARLNTYNYRYSVESTKTDIEIKVPENGYIIVTNDIKENPVAFVYGMTSIAVDTAFQIAEDLMEVEDTKKTTVASKIKKKVSDYFKNDIDFWESFAKKLSKEIITDTTELSVAGLGNFSLDVVTAIFNKMDQDFCSVFDTVLKDVVKDAGHTLVKMGVMKQFIDKKLVNKATGGYFKAAEMIFNASDRINAVDEILDLIFAVNSGSTTISFGKCNENGFVCKDSVSVTLKEEDEILDSLYLQHFEMYTDRKQLSLRPAFKELNLKEDATVELHEITIMKDGVPYDIKQIVCVEIDVPKGWQTLNLKVYRVEPDGSFTDMLANVAGGKVRFTTDHFSEYLLTGEIDEQHKHEYDEITITSSCAKTGMELYTCYCGYSYTVPLPTADHSDEDQNGLCDVCKKNVNITPGDIDGDGEVTSSDARLALRAAVKLDTLTDAQTQAADADKNGEIEAADARLILRAAVGLGTLK